MKGYVGTPWAPWQGANMGLARSAPSVAQLVCAMALKAKKTPTVPRAMKKATRDGVAFIASERNTGNSLILNYGFA